jgi:hypothetical protein
MRRGKQKLMEKRDANTNRRGIQVAGVEEYSACCRDRGEKVAGGKGYKYSIAREEEYRLQGERERVSTLQ